MVLAFVLTPTVRRILLSVASRLIPLTLPRHTCMGLFASTMAVVLRWW